MPVSKNVNMPRTVSPRIKELQQKIQDETYVHYAIERIALIVSREIAEKGGSSPRAAARLY